MREVKGSEKKEVSEAEKRRGSERCREEEMK
jgi:hypothetical protein